MSNNSTVLPPNKQEYYVYLIQGRHTLITKIGISDNPKRRLRDLQRHSPEPLHLAATLQCEDEQEARETERALHYTFRKKNAHHEWFKTTALNVIERSELEFIWHEVNFTHDLRPDGAPPYPLISYPVQVRTVTSEPKAPKKTWPLNVVMFSLISLKLTFALAVALEVQPQYDLSGLTAIAAASGLASTFAWRVL